MEKKTCNNEGVVLHNNEQTNKEFLEGLDKLMVKANKLSELSKGYVTLKKEITDEASNFIEKYHENQKQELTKAMIWMKPILEGKDLVRVLGHLSQSDKARLSLNRDLMESFASHYNVDKLRLTSPDLAKSVEIYEDYLNQNEYVHEFDTNNILDENNYLITDKLSSFLTYRLHKPSNPVVKNIKNKRPSGLYIVMFNKINDNLIYKYLNYNKMFLPLLYEYIIGESGYIPSKDHRSIGTNHLFVINTKDSNHVTSMFDKVLDNFSLNGDTNLRKATFINWAKITLRGCPLVLNTDSTSQLLVSAGNKKYNDVANTIVKYARHNGIEYDIHNPNKIHFPPDNILDKIVILTDDLSGLLVGVEKFLGNKVNQGIQSHRGEVDTLASTISYLDGDFRLSMFKHHAYHVDRNPHDPRFIPRNAFSFYNVHVKNRYLTK